MDGRDDYGIRIPSGPRGKGRGHGGNGGRGGHRGGGYGNGSGPEDRSHGGHGHDRRRNDRRGHGPDGRDRSHGGHDFGHGGRDFGHGGQGHGHGNGGFGKGRGGHGGGRPSRPHGERYGFAERAPAPATPPIPEAPPPAAYQANVFGSFDERLQYAIADMGYAIPTPIQEQAIPHLMAGRDLVGCAQTGTGKTAAFLLPALHKIAVSPRETPPGSPRVLVLSPTRELAAQTAENAAAFSKYTGAPFAVVFGGVSQFHQVKALRRGAQTVIATPGRLIDLMTQGIVSLDEVEIFVLDEADRMLDMGFLPDIKRIIGKLPPERQSLFFSATLTPEAMKLADSLVRDPVKISVAPERPAADKIDQRVMFVEKADKDKLLVHVLSSHPEWYRAIVFARTRHNADRIERKLHKAGISAATLHSDKSQAQRTRALDGFRKGTTRVLVATDIASRGIDVQDVAAVVNMEFPDEPESYIHRIGRTARAGGSGIAVTFMDAAERGRMKAAERAAKAKIAPDRDHPFHSERAEAAAGAAKQAEGMDQPPWFRRGPGPRRGEGRGRPGGGNGGRPGAPRGRDGKGPKGRGGPPHGPRRPDFKGARQSDFGRGAPQE